MDVVVCRKTLTQLENEVYQFKLDMIHQIGQNYLSKTDYMNLVEWYSGDLIMDMIHIIRYTILVKIHKNYIRDEISLKKFIRKCI